MRLKWGFSELQQQLASTPAQLADMQRMYADVATLKPNYWRMMAPWNMVAKSKDPGAVTFDSVNQVPTNANRDWTYIDRCINDILLTGADIVMMIGQARPSWAGGGAESWVWFAFLAAVSASTAAPYGEFCAEVATRYKPGGPGIRTDGIYAANAGKGVTIFECWNEQNHSSFWVGTVDPKVYVAYLKAGYTAIKNVSGLAGSSSKVLFGGLQHIPRNAFAAQWSAAGVPEVTFVQKCYEAEPSLGSYYDVMSDHIYTADDKTVFNGSTLGPTPDMNTDNMRQLTEIYSLMQAKGDGGKPVWLTEVGWTTATQTQTQQREYMRDLFAKLDALPYCEVALIYNVRDVGTDPQDPLQGYGVEKHTYIDPKTPSLGFVKKEIWSWLQTLQPTISSPVAQATAQVLAPTIAVTQGSPVAQATAQVLPPAIKSGTGLDVDKATASAAILAPTIKTSVAYTLVAGQHPFNDVGDGYTITTLGGQPWMVENAHPTTTNGEWFSAGAWPTPMGTVLHSAEVEIGDNGADRGSGPGVAGSDDDLTDCVFAIGEQFGGATALTIYTKIGSSIIARSTANVQFWLFDKIRLKVTYSFGTYTYSVYKNGNTSPVLAWADTGNVFTPGLYTGAWFKRIISGAQFGSPGIRATFYASDN